MGSEIVYYGGMVLVGMVLGAFFFGGLWLTVKQVSKSRHPILLTVGSGIVRTAGVMLGIWYFSGGQAGGMIWCVIGLGLMRVLATHGSLLPEHQEPSNGKPA